MRDLDPEFVIAPSFMVVSRESSAQPDSEQETGTGFVVQSRETTATIRTPRGQHEEPWWDSVSIDTQASRVTLEPMRNSLIRQAPRTCWLTNTLNAWVLRGALSSQQASRIQDTMLKDPIYTGNFTPGTDHWGISNPAIPAFAIREATGQRVRFARVQGEEAGPPHIDRLIRRGHIAVVGTEQHFRTAFMPHDYPGKLAVIDPIRPQTPSLYPLQDMTRVLASIHTVRQTVII